MKTKDNKRKGKKLRFLWRVVLIAIALVFLALVGMFAMTQKVPDAFSSYVPSPETEEVSRYITHYLAPNVHNNIQLDAPFEIVASQNEINEIIGEEELLGWQWPVKFNKVIISRPVVVFAPKTIRLMGKVDIAGFDTVITICANPSIGKDGMLRLNLQYVRAGTLDISFLVKKTVKKIIEEQMDQVGEQYWLNDILAACQENKPFDPIFPIVYSKYIKLIGSKISENRLILVFQPSSKQEIADTSADDNGLYDTP